MKERTYFCIDMKSFYASAECAERGLNPFETNLVVADPERGKNSLCLAITPKMKAQGIKNRCRTSDIPKGIKYLVAMPRMQLYIDYAAEIYAIYLKYIDKNDIHVYSIDEAFLDVTDYLRMYQTDAFSFAKKLMNEILEKTHIPSTAGIGTNLYLAKVALDITAKHAKDHIGYLDEETYQKTLWNHKPLTDFWQIASGKAGRLARYGITDMYGIAHAPQDLLQRLFGKDWILIYDHAWGREPCLISDIKEYTPKGHSVSFSQILPKDYDFATAKIVMAEMVENGCYEMMKRHVITQKVGIYVGYSSEMHEPTGGSVKMSVTTNLPSKLQPYVMGLYEKTTAKGYLIRRLGIVFENVCDEGCEGYDLFTDFDQVEREKKREHTVLEIKERFGKNAILTATSYLEGATQKERNTFIGGHKA